MVPLLREQLSLQRKVLWVGRVAIAASAIPWALIALGMWAHFGSSSPSAPPTVVSVERPAAPLKPAPRKERPRIASASIQHAFSSGRSRWSNARVRATAHAREALLRAPQRGVDHVHVVSLTQREVQILSGQAYFRTRIVPVTLPDGGQGFKVLRLARADWRKRIGIERGDIIVGVNGQRLASPDAALSACTEAERARHLVLELLRQGRRHVISVTWAA